VGPPSTGGPTIYVGGGLSKSSPPYLFVKEGVPGDIVGPPWVEAFNIGGVPHNTPLFNI
jgi:hypothetical protein